MEPLSCVPAVRPGLSSLPGTGFPHLSDEAPNPFLSRCQEAPHQRSPSVGHLPP